MSNHDLIAVLPELVLLIGGVVLMLFGSPRKGPARRWCSTVALSAIFLAALLLIYQRGMPPLVFSEMFSTDPFGRFFRLLFYLIAALVVLGSREYVLRERLATGEYYALVLWATIGMSMMAASNELILTFIGLEISSLASYVLVGFRTDNAASSESSLKYFLLGSFATAFLLYGVALLYGIAGTTRLTDVREVLLGGHTPISASAPGAVELAEGAVHSVQLSWVEAGFPSTLLAVSIALLFVGLAFKVSAAPFQVWTPDVYQGAPAPVAGFLSTGPKAAAFAAFLRIFQFSLIGSAAQWSAALWGSAVLTMFIGNLAAMWQSNVKRLLAYSSIAHAGYVLVAFTAHSAEGTAAVLFYLAAYTFMNIGAFAVIGHVAGLGERYVHVDDYRGLGFRSPVLAACLSIFLLSLIGIPLTAGFLGKFYVFRAAISADLVWLTVLAVLNSAIAAYYYLRLVVAMYMQPPTRDVPIAPLDLPTRGVLAVCTVATFLLGIVPHPVLRMAARAARWFPG